MHTNMTRAAQKIGMNFPNKRQRVIALLDSIENTHPSISVHILTIKSDTNGLGSDFESTVSHLFKANPVEKLSSKSNKQVVISSASGGRRSNTGVEFCRYHTREFKELSQNQIVELKE